jgi:hypothetical protein
MIMSASVGCLFRLLSRALLIIACLQNPWQPSAIANHEKLPTRHVLLDCPTGYSLGNLYLVHCSLTDQILNQRQAQKAGIARGRVIVRGQGNLMLVGSYELSEHMQDLKKFKANDLQVLDLQKLTFNDQDLKYISALSGLKRVDLDSTDTSDKSLKYLGELPQLVSLGLARTMITGATLDQLAGLKFLTRLEIGHNIINHSKMANIAGLKHLTVLRAQSCQLIDSDLKYIAQLADLHTLVIHQNPKITDNGLKNLAPLKNLTYLDLSQTHVTVAGLKQLKHFKLRTLRLDRNQFNEKQLAQIRGIFPTSEIKLESIIDRVDIDLFAPLH